MDLIEREHDQEAILALALYLAQNYGNALTGMTAEMWVVEAKEQRKKVEAIQDVFYDE